MQRTHLGWEAAKDDVFCHRGDTRSESLGNESVYRRMNNTPVLASSFSEVSLGIDMVDVGGRRGERRACCKVVQLPHQDIHTREAQGGFVYDHQLKST